MHVEILLIAVLTAMTTSLVGVFLVLRKLSMLTDAISHTVLLGIVIAFMLVGDINSPLLIIGATFMGVFTVYLIELLIKTNRVKADAAIGVVFTFLFSISVIIISTQLRNVHLHISTVLLGNLEFAMFDRTTVFGISMPVSLLIMGVVFLLNVSILSVFYKEVKLISFDQALAGALGFTPVLIHYVMMTMVSLTAVAAFNAVGAILVIALMVGPPITALFFTKSLFKTILLTMAIAMINSVGGYQLSVILDVTISGSIASVTLFTFFLAFIFAPKKGLIGKLSHHKKQRESLALQTILIHVLNHEHDEDAEVELNPETLHEHLNWPNRFVDKLLHKAQKKGYITTEHALLTLTVKGEHYVSSLNFIK